MRRIRRRKGCPDGGISPPCNDPGSSGLSVRMLRPTALIILGAAALAVLSILWGPSLSHLLADVQRVRRFVASFGIWAPLALIGLEAIQVVLAPVPGGLVELTSGYLFGPGWGTLYSMTGLMGGTVIALNLARRFGRPVVERFVPSRTLKRFDRYTCHRGTLFFLLLLLTPFIPNDVVCYLAGLTSLPLVMLILVAAIGRLPGVLVTNWMGAHAAALTLPQLLLVGVLLLLIALGFWTSQERIEEFLLRLVVRLDERLIK